jgi:hypothetical protein
MVRLLPRPTLLAKLRLPLILMVTLPLRRKPQAMLLPTLTLRVMLRVMLRLMVLLRRPRHRRQPGSE